MQSVFMLGRPDGFLWEYPGVRSLLVNYEEANDFFFSSHVGVTALFSMEFKAIGWIKSSFIASLLCIDMWVLLMLLRTHYVIDFISGLIFAVLSHHFGEKISFFIDVKVFGYRRCARQKKDYDPCPRCGWGNMDPTLLINTQEYIA